MNKETLDTLHLDPEWVELIKEARNIGLDVNEIRNFLVQTIASRNLPTEPLCSGQ